MARQLWREKRLIPPTGEDTALRNLFNKFLMVCTVYTGFIVPLFACFQIGYHPVHLIVDYVIDLLFWAEMALIMRTAFLDVNNDLVVNKKAIQINYARRRLYWDLAANSPWELFAMAAGHSYTSPFFSACRLLRLLRFFRLKKVAPAVLVDPSSSFGRRVVNMYPLIIHWVACIWWAIGSSGLRQGYVGKQDWEGGSSWLTRSSGPSESHQYNPQTLQPTTGLDAYLSALYWATATLIKTAWIAPSTAIEKVYATVVVSLGAIMFAIFLGQFFKIIQSFDEGTAQRREKMSTFQAFCVHNKLSKTISRSIVAYAMAEWNATRGVSTGDTLKKLSGNLSGQLLYEIRKDVLQSCNLLSTTSLACAKKLLLASTVQVCLKNEFVIGEGQLVRELLILNKGSLQVSVPNSGSHSLRKTKGPKGLAGGSKKNLLARRMLEKQGAVCGVWSPYEKSARYPYEVQAKDFTTMLNISRSALLGVMNQFDDDRPTILAMLEKEHALVQSALKLDGARKSPPRLSVGSFSSSQSESDRVEQEDEEKEAIRPEKKRELLLDVLGGLDSVSNSIRLVRRSAAGTRRESMIMRDVLKKLGYADQSRSTSRRSSELGNPQLIRTNSQALRDPNDGHEDKREIVRDRKNAADAGTAASIVL